MEQRVDTLLIQVVTGFANKKCVFVSVKNFDSCADLELGWYH